MIVLIAIAFGVVMGAATAKKRGGRNIDAAQYSAVYGIAFGLLGLFLTIFIERMI